MKHLTRFIDTLNYNVTGERQKLFLLTKENGCKVVSNGISHYQFNSVVPFFRYTRECVGSGSKWKGIRAVKDIFITIISCVEYANCKVNIRYSNTSTLKWKQNTIFVEKKLSTTPMFSDF